jgi:hypothetical protein
MEGVLGTIETTVAILATLTLYIIGRKAHLKNTIPLVGFVTILYLMGAGFLAFNYTWIGVLVFIAISSISSSIRWTMGYSVVMEVLDRDEINHPTAGHYAYICDNELFFNIGRILGLGIFVGLLQFSADTALRFTPLIIALTQFGSLVPLRYLVKTLQVKV